MDKCWCDGSPLLSLGMEIVVEEEELIPGLPREIAELCLVHVPYPYQPLSRSVSSTWNRAITHPSFIYSKKILSRPLPHLFVIAIHSQTHNIHCQAFDPSSGRWFLLPQIPLPQNTSPTAFAYSALPTHGKLFLIGSHTLVYHAATNRWSLAPGLPEHRGLLAAVGLEGKIVVVGRGGTDIYEPESETWREGKALGRELDRYEAVAAGGKVYVTEGWWWPLVYRPRGWVYEKDRERWREMGIGMREGWTGVGVGAGGRVFMIAEYGDAEVKVYDEESDTWRNVKGGRLPREVIKRPFSAVGLEDRIYVAGIDLNVGIAIVKVVSRCEVSLTWEVVEAPPAFRQLSPSSCQVLYA